MLPSDHIHRVDRVHLPFHSPRMTLTLSPFFLNDQHLLPHPHSQLRTLLPTLLRKVKHPESEFPKTPDYLHPPNSNNLHSYLKPIPSLHIRSYPSCQLKGVPPARLPSSPASSASLSLGHHPHCLVTTSGFMALNTICVARTLAFASLAQTSLAASKFQHPMGDSTSSHGFFTAI